MISLLPSVTLFPSLSSLGTYTQRAPRVSYPTDSLPYREAAACENRAPTLARRPSTTTVSAAYRTAVSASSDPSLTPPVLRQDVRPGNNVVGVFSAEGSWDPVFVMAPPRLVGLQNHAAARERGRRRARQVAWRRINRPEVRTRDGIEPRRWTTLEMLFVAAGEGGCQGSLSGRAPKRPAGLKQTKP